MKNVHTHDTKDDILKEGRRQRFNNKRTNHIYWVVCVHCVM